MNDALYAPEAERATLGAVLTDGGVWTRLRDTVAPDDFYLLRHQHIAAAFEHLYKAREVVDMVTVSDTLRSRGVYEDIGGGAYLVALLNDTPTTVNAPTYAALVNRLAVRRRLLEAADAIRTAALDTEQHSTPDVLALARNAITQVATGLPSSRGRAWSDVVVEAYEEFERRSSGSQSGVFGIPTGLRDVDYLLNGLVPGRLYVVAGRPGSGKSALIVNMAVNMARAGVPVAMFSNEMAATEHAMRGLALAAGVPYYAVERPRPDAYEANHAITKAAGVELPIWLDDNPVLKPAVLEAEVARAVDAGTRVVLVDGMYRMYADAPTKSYHEKYTEIARALKNIAATYRVPVVATHQLSRAVEQRQDKRPMLSDLRESGTIEEEADVVAFCYRHEYYFPNDVTARGQAELSIAKNRSGQTGVVQLGFKATHLLWHDAQNTARTASKAV